MLLSIKIDWHFVFFAGYYVFCVPNKVKVCPLGNFEQI